MTYRRFAEADEKIAEAWAGQPHSLHQWILGVSIGRGEAGSYHANADGAGRAAAKPGFDARGTPRAAHEKIACDLAKALHLPVPAVCLWEHQGRQFAVSKWAFVQALTWGEIATRLSPTFMQNVAPTFSAARVFHSWIGDSDHNGNPGNVIVDADSTETSPGIAFIDHAFSMSHGPDFGSRPLIACPISYIQAASYVPDAARGMVNAINGLEANFIQNTVERIPAQFLPQDRGKAIIEGLLKRRGELAAVFGVQ